MKKVCVVTAARSEYGLLKCLLEELSHSTLLQLQLVVTGSHLSPEHGLTVHEIEHDGFQIDKKVEMLLSTVTSTGIGVSMGICMISISEVFMELSPDLLVVLGDRYELLPICNVALIMRIPIAHISGGDITEGAIDDQIRNAVTMMSDLHFPATSESAERVVRMRGSEKNVFVVGEPGLDNFSHYELMDRKTLADNLNLSIHTRWILLTLHPETKENLGYNVELANNLIKALGELSNIQIIITQANADLGGGEINAFFRDMAKQEPERIRCYASLGQLRYLSFMKEVYCMIGNSSSGIVEAPFLGTPVINVGKRQLGRHICHNVINVSGTIDSIRKALDDIAKCDVTPDYFYGDGMSSRKILTHIHQYLLL